MSNNGNYRERKKRIEYSVDWCRFIESWSRLYIWL